MGYRIAGIDVHQKMLTVVVAEVEAEGESEFERRKLGSNPEHLRWLAEWLLERGVEEAVMESTAQYWQPVWGALERYGRPSCLQREGAGPGQCRESCIWHRHVPIAGGGGGRKISRRGTMGKTVGSTRTRAELRTRSPNSDSGARGPYQDVQFGFGSSGGQCAVQAVAKGETDPAVLAAMADRSSVQAPRASPDCADVARKFVLVENRQHQDEVASPDGWRGEDAHD
jgi:hypothetical protein